MYTYIRTCIYVYVYVYVYMMHVYKIYVSIYNMYTHTSCFLCCALPMTVPARAGQEQVSAGRDDVSFVVFLRGGLNLF